MIFFGIPEEVNEASAKTKSLLESFLGDELKLKEDDIDGISIPMSNITTSSFNVRGLGNKKNEENFSVVRKEKVFYLHAARGSLYWTVLWDLGRWMGL